MIELLTHFINRTCLGGVAVLSVAIFVWCVYKYITTAIALAQDEKWIGICMILIGESVVFLTLLYSIGACLWK